MAVEDLALIVENIKAAFRSRGVEIDVT